MASPTKPKSKPSVPVDNSLSTGSTGTSTSRTFARLKSLSTLDFSFRTSTRSRKSGSAVVTPAVNARVDEFATITRDKGKAKEHEQDRDTATTPTPSSSSTNVLRRVTFRQPDRKSSRTKGRKPDSDLSDPPRPSRMAGFTSFITPSLRQASKSSPALGLTVHPPSSPEPSTPSRSSSRADSPTTSRKLKKKEISPPVALNNRHRSTKSFAAPGPVSILTSPSAPHLPSTSSPPPTQTQPSSYLTPTASSSRRRVSIDSDTHTRPRSPVRVRTGTPTQARTSSQLGVHRGPVSASTSQLPSAGTRSVSPTNGQNKRVSDGIRRTSLDTQRGVNGANGTIRGLTSASTSHLPSTSSRMRENASPSPPPLARGGIRRTSLDARGSGSPTPGRTGTGTGTPTNANANPRRTSIDARRPSLDITVDARRPSLDAQARRASIEQRTGVRDSPTLSGQRGSDRTGDREREGDTERDSRTSSPINPNPKPRARSPIQRTYAQNRHFSVSSGSLVLGSSTPTSPTTPTSPSFPPTGVPPPSSFSPPPIHGYHHRGSASTSSVNLIHSNSNSNSVDLRDASTRYIILHASSLLLSSLGLHPHPAPSPSSNSSNTSKPPPHMLKGTDAQIRQAHREWEEVKSRVMRLGRVVKGWDGVYEVGVHAGVHEGNGEVRERKEKKERQVFCDTLRDGYVLCHLLNTLRSSTLVRPDAHATGASLSASSSVNITKFLAACASYGLGEEDLFGRGDFLGESESESEDEDGDESRPSHVHKHTRGADTRNAENQDQDQDHDISKEAVRRVANTIIKLVGYVDTPAPSRMKWVRGGGQVPAEKVREREREEERRRSEEARRQEEEERIRSEEGEEGTTQIGEHRRAGGTGSGSGSGSGSSMFPNSNSNPNTNANPNDLGRSTSRAGTVSPCTPSNPKVSRSSNSTSANPNSTANLNPNANPNTFRDTTTSSPSPSTPSVNQRKDRATVSGSGSDTNRDIDIDRESESASASGRGRTAIFAVSATSATSASGSSSHLGHLGNLRDLGASSGEGAAANHRSGAMLGDKDIYGRRGRSGGGEIPGPTASVAASVSVPEGLVPVPVPAPAPGPFSGAGAGSGAISTSGQVLPLPSQDDTSILGLKSLTFGRDTPTSPSGKTKTKTPTGAKPQVQVEGGYAQTGSYSRASASVPNLSTMSKATSPSPSPMMSPGRSRPPLHNGGGVVGRDRAKGSRTGAVSPSLSSASGASQSHSQQSQSGRYNYKQTQRLPEPPSKALSSSSTSAAAAALSVSQTSLSSASQTSQGSQVSQAPPTRPSLSLSQQQHSSSYFPRSYYPPSSSSPSPSPARSSPMPAPSPSRSPASPMRVRKIADLQRRDSSPASASANSNSSREREKSSFSASASPSERDRTRRLRELKVPVPVPRVSQSRSPGSSGSLPRVFNDDDDENSEDEDDEDEEEDNFEESFEDEDEDEGDITEGESGYARSRNGGQVYLGGDEGTLQGHQVLAGGYSQRMRIRGRDVHDRGRYNVDVDEEDVDEYQEGESFDDDERGVEDEDDVEVSISVSYPHKQRHGAAPVPLIKTPNVPLRPKAPLTPTRVVPLPLHIPPVPPIPIPPIPSTPPMKPSKSPLRKITSKPSLASINSVSSSNTVNTVDLGNGGLERWARGAASPSSNSRSNSSVGGMGGGIQIKPQLQALSRSNTGTGTRHSPVGTSGLSPPASPRHGRRVSPPQLQIRQRDRDRSGSGSLSASAYDPSKSTASTASDRSSMLSASTTHTNIGSGVGVGIGSGHLGMAARSSVADSLQADNGSITGMDSPHLRRRDSGPSGYTQTQTQTHGQGGNMHTQTGHHPGPHHRDRHHPSTQAQVQHQHHHHLPNLNHFHYPAHSSSSLSSSPPLHSPLHQSHSPSRENWFGQEHRHGQNSSGSNEPPSPIQHLQTRQSVASTTPSEATTATTAVSSILDGGGGGWNGMRRYGGHHNNLSGGSSGGVGNGNGHANNHNHSGGSGSAGGSGNNNNNFGTIRTVTTDMTSEGSTSVSRADGSMMLEEMAGYGGRKRSSLDRERKLSGAGVDLMRVMEEEGVHDEVGGEMKARGLRERGRAMSPSKEKLNSHNTSASPVSAVHLRKGKWPDDFMDVFGSQPNSAPATNTRFASASPPPHRHHPDVGSPLSSPLSISPPRKLAIVGARRSDPDSATGAGGSGSSTPDRGGARSPPMPRRPTHRPRHSLDTSSGLLPKESLLRREASPDSSTGSSSRMMIRRHSTKPGLVSAGGRPGSRGGSGGYVPRVGSGAYEGDPPTPTSEASDRGGSVSGERPTMVPFPRSVSGPGGAGEHGGTPSPRSSTGAEVLLDRPRMVRGRFTSDIEGSSARRKARPNSYDELGGRPMRSRFESMVNLGVASAAGGATASDLMARERDSMDGSAVRARLVVREDGKPPTHFQLGNCIGRGQFGSVYRALNLNTGQMVAVKRIRLEGLKEEEVTQLMREVDLVKSLSHPSIVKYEGMVRDENTLNIILEYAENGSLGQTLKSFGKLNEALVARYVVKILEGLHYLHTSDVVHCDLKAANILTTKNGNVKLSDFGVSLNLRAMEREMKDVAGTPNWMAPEVIELKGASTKSDIWSLGCTVVELLTGRPPYAEIANSMTVMFRIVEDPMPPLPDDCDEMLTDFLMLCFNKDPSQRPSAEDLFQHPWLKRNWSAFKDLRAQDSIPFIRRVSADLQKPDVRYLSQLDIPDTPLSSSPKDGKLTPIGHRTSTSSVRPEADFSPREHSFVKTSFSKPMICRVCLLNVKKTAVLCSQCSLISHSKCASNAPPTCDLRAQLLLYAQYAEKGNPPSAYSNPAENSDPHPVAMSDVAFVEHSRTSLDGIRPSGLTPPEHPPTAFKLIAAFKRSRSNLTPEPGSAQLGTSPPTPRREEERIPKKRSTTSKRSERPMSISSNHTGVSSLHSAATANESFSSRQNTGKRSQFSGGSDKSRPKSTSAIPEVPTSTKQVHPEGEQDVDDTQVPGSLPVDPRRVKKRGQSSGNCTVQ